MSGNFSQNPTKYTFCTWCAASYTVFKFHLDFHWQMLMTGLPLWKLWFEIRKKIQLLVAEWVYIQIAECLMSNAEWMHECMNGWKGSVLPIQILLSHNLEMSSGLHLLDSCRCFWLIRMGHILAIRSCGYWYGVDVFYAASELYTGVKYCLL